MRDGKDVAIFIDDKFVEKCRKAVVCWFGCADAVEEEVRVVNDLVAVEEVEMDGELGFGKCS